MIGKITFAKDENIKTLVGLGLSGTEAKVCLTLVTIRTSTIRQISEASGVARSETYCAIIELEKKGFVEKSLSTPTKYSLLPLHDLLSSLIGQKDRESLELQEKSAKLLNEYEQKISDHQSGADGQFVLVPSAKLFSNRLEDLIENAQESVCIVATQKEFMKLFASRSDPLERVLQKQVAFSVATEKRRSNRLTKLMRGLQKKAHLEFRYLSILPVFSLATFDGKKMLLSINSHTTKGKLNAVYSNNLGLVELAQSYFNGLWSSATEPLNLEFRRTKLQLDYLYKNMINAFAYCKIIFDGNMPVDFVYLQVNEAFERILGLKRSQLIGKRVSKVVPGFEKENCELFQMLGRVCQTQKGEQCEIFLKPMNRWRRMSVYSPKRGYVAVLFEDITERKKAELELKHKYDLLESLGENVDAGLVIVDRDYRIVWVNDMLKRAGACPGKLCYEALAHSEMVCPDCGVKKVFQEKIPVDIHEYKGINSKGETNWVELRVTPLKDESGNVTSALELAVSINERKKAEDALKQSKKELSRILDSSPINIFYKDKNGRLLQVNEALAKSLNMRKEKILGKTVFDLYSPDIAQSMTDDDSSVLQSKRPKQGIIEQCNSTIGLRWKRTDKFPILDENGNLDGLIGFSDDITESMRIEEILKRHTQNFASEQERLFSFMGNLPIALCLITTDYQIIFSNRSLHEKFGEPGKKHCYEYFHHQSAPCSFCEAFEAIKTGKPHIWKFSSPNGLKLEVQDFPYTDMNGRELVLEVILDVTQEDRKNYS